MNQSRKREFKAPWKEPEQSMHETVTTPAHLSQKWMDTFSFGEKSRKSRLFDQESKETQKQANKQHDHKTQFHRLIFWLTLLCNEAPIRIEDNDH